MIDTSLKIHILLIENNSFETILAEDELRHTTDEQISLVRTEHLSDALSLIAQESFDLILSHLDLPDCNGPEIINQLRKQATHVPIALLSSKDNEELSIQVIKAGIQDFLVKDQISSRILMRIIRYAIERKQTEENTKKTQQRFQTIFEEVPLGIAVINVKTGEFIDVNQKYASITGRTTEELMQINQSEIIHPDDLQDYVDSLNLLAEQKLQNFKTAKRIICPDGSLIWLETLIKPFETNCKSCKLCMKEDNSSLCIMEYITEYGKLDANWRDLTMYSQDVREEERSRIGREIHDVLGGTLTVLKMDLDWLSKKVPDNPMHERILSLYQLTGEAIETVRRISKNLRPNVLDNLGLHGAIEWLVREFGQRLNINSRLQSNVQHLSYLDKKSETNIFRIIQEAFINITKHAQATAIEINIEENPHQLTFKVKDNGVGITDEQLLNSKSFGIIGMQERAKQMGAKLTIKGTPSGGSRLQLQVPIQHSQNIAKERTA
ncbi:MAG: response regulator [Nitrosomonas sp.]|nr:response regulator [Nitrosomonas sp.]